MHDRRLGADDADAIEAVAKNDGRPVGIGLVEPEVEEDVGVIADAPDPADGLDANRFEVDADDLFAPAPLTGGPSPRPTRKTLRS